MTAEQHAAVEMVYVELSNQVDWPRGSGIKRTPWQWHQIIVAAFAEEQGWTPEYLPSLRGGGFVMATRTKQSRLTKRQGSELIDFAKATAIDLGAQLREPEATPA